MWNLSRSVNHHHTNSIQDKFIMTLCILRLRAAPDRPLIVANQLLALRQLEACVVRQTRPVLLYINLERVEQKSFRFLWLIRLPVVQKQASTTAAVELVYGHFATEFKAFLLRYDKFRIANTTVHVCSLHVKISEILGDELGRADSSNVFICPHC